jgi:hypothetical protein
MILNKIKFLIILTLTLNLKYSFAKEEYQHIIVTNSGYEIIIPQVQEKQNFNKNIQIQYEFGKVADSEIYGNGGDLCYMGMMRILSMEQGMKYALTALGSLFYGIIANINFLEKNTLNYLLNHLLIELLDRLIKSLDMDTKIINNNNEKITKFFARNVVGYIFGKSINDLYLEKSLDKLNKNNINELLKQEDVYTWDLQGHNAKEKYKRTSQLTSVTIPFTMVKAKLFYSPYTHFTSLVANVKCTYDNNPTQNQNRIYNVSYEIVKTKYDMAQKVGDLKINYIDLNNKNE